MNFKHHLLLLILLLLPTPGLALTIGTAPVPGSSLPKGAQLEQFADYLSRQLGEKTTIREFADQATLDAWMNRFGEVDLGFVEPALVKSRPWAYPVVVEALPAGQAGSWPLVARQDLDPARAERLRQILTGMTVEKSGRELLAKLGIAAFVTHGRAPAAPAAVAAVEPAAPETLPAAPQGALEGGEDVTSSDPIAAILNAESSDQEMAAAAAADVAPGDAEPFPAVAPSAQQVTLRQAERLALEQNLSLKAQGYDLLAGVAAERKGYGIYDPLFSLTLARGKNQQRLNQLSTVSQSNTDYRIYDAGVSQQIVTGGKLGLDFTNQRTSYDFAPGVLYNPNYASELKLSLTQPLLKNFGRTVTEQAILFAVKDRQRSLEDLRNQAFTVLAGVRDAYYEVLRSRDELTYRQTSLELAQRVLKENRARVNAGVMAPIDILEAEVGVKQRERDLLDAQRQQQDALDNLALLLNSQEPVRAGDELLEVPELATDLETGFQAALAGRPDIQKRLRDMERLQIEQEVAGNQRLPGLDLSAAYSHKGLGQSYSDDWEDVSSDRFPNWQVGVTLSYPLGNRAADNEVLRNRVRLKSLQARLAQLHEEVRNEIRTAIRSLDVNRKKIEVSARGRELAEEKLRTLLKRKEVGLATTRDVLQGEDDLALARTSEITARADYNKAVTQYLRVTGELLEHEGVYFTGNLDPKSDARLMQMQN
ncbi:RND family efflux pump outer membrane protein [Desulfuromonas sp. DDH964]|uniref:TolC family protein n=1 Tax=Desulfuromonas sp. DDH964 TaxID=1823759 RepID=UPI00078E1923|nr:TolC family protein [Desulfuromonas sp. DDH964]AMV71831.1 RND family efflux pump outer membrane protein [Desulfuromonas sp. DDH964]